MSPKVLDVSELPAVAFSHRTTLFWGAIGVSLIEVTMFLLLAATYFYARLGVDVWPPPGAQLPHRLLPTIELVLLLLSVPPAYWSSQAAKHNELRKTRRYLWLNGLLGLAAMAVRAVIWSTLNYNWKADIQGSVVWAILVLHTFDVLAGLAITFVLLLIAYTTKYSDSHRKAIDFDSVTWYFLVAVWVVLYATIYIGPYVVQAS